jgi:hypothetical protein
MRWRTLLSTIVLAWMPGAMLLGAGTESPSPPTGERDLVVFVAREKPELYRLVGRQPAPYGSARFTRPKAIVADPAGRCFYVFDEPQRLDEPRKIWRIDGQGNPTMIFQGNLTMHNGPFGKPTGLGLDETGRLLVADAMTGLWRLETDGRLQRLIEGKDKPLYRITAASAVPGQGLLVGTSYLYEITGGQMLDLPKRMVGDPPREFEGTWSPSPSYANPASVELGNTGVGNSTGRQTPIRIWQNQGGLYRLSAAGPQVKVEGLLANQKLGSAEYDTYWRTLSQVFVDAAGRVVLVDAGSVWKRTEDVYIRPNQRTITEYSPKRTFTSTINGGILLLHPDGRFEDLTFKTPQNNSGPLRRPTGAAQWSDDTYIVADPELYVEGINGAGGLLLITLDGSREARWPFGYRLKPLGVAILRGAGMPAKTKPALPIRIADLAGVATAGSITRIESVSLERKPEATGGGLIPPLILKWDPQPAAQAEQMLRSFFEGAQWTVAQDGTLQFVARDVTPQQEGTPLVMRGKVTVHEQMANASASYQKKSLYDTQLGSIDARLNRSSADNVTINATINVFTNTERLKATFEQTMPWRQRN